MNAALTAVRLSGELDCPPPHYAELEAYAELERAVVSGRACEGASAVSAERLAFLERDGSVERRASHTMLVSLYGWLRSGRHGHGPGVCSSFSRGREAA